jgi:sugar/nucleoside kinase (ribokinase family)
VTRLDVIGNISRDVTRYPDHRGGARLGGAALFVALAAARAGRPSAPVCVLGEDLAHVPMALGLDGLDWSAHTEAEGPSAHFDLRYDLQGELVEVRTDYGVADRLTVHALAHVDRHPHGHYHVCCRRPLDTAAVLDRLVHNGSPFSVDFFLPSAEEMIRSAAPWLTKANTVFVNAGEYRLLQALVDTAALPEVVVTDGPRAARVLALGQHAASVVPPSRSAREVSGAGDTWPAPSSPTDPREPHLPWPLRQRRKQRLTSWQPHLFPSRRNAAPDSLTWGLLLVSIYVAHRLFAAHDRALAAAFAERLAAKAGAERVFLPFCDTDEEDLVAEVKGRRLFELDRERLARLDAMVALLHGPSLDDGVCMEIGYAAASGVPVLVLTTDFQTYSLTEDGDRLDFPDPLVQAVASRVIRVPRLGPPSSSHPQGSTHYAAFLSRNLSQVDAALDAAVEAVLELPAPGQRTTATRRDCLVYVEGSPYSAWGRDHLAQPCLDAGHGVVLPRRFTVADPVGGARDDLSAACGASRLLADVSGPETPPGTAVLIGAALASGVQIGAFSPRPTYTHAPGREPNRRNLMIQYAVHAHLDGTEAVRAWLAT